MATINKKIIGEITGRIGDVVQRRRYGKIVAYSRPAKYKISKSVAAKEGRNRFALSVAFAKSVNAVPELKQIWKYAKIEGVVPYNRIIKHNRNLSAGDHLTTGNIITPPGYFLKVNDFTFNNPGINITITTDEPGLKNILQHPFMCCLTIYLFNPKKKQSPSFFINTFIKQFNGFTSAAAYDLQSDLDPVITKQIKNYKQMIIYSAVSAIEAKKKSVYWSNTFAQEFNL